MVDYKWQRLKAHNLKVSRNQNCPDRFRLLAGIDGQARKSRLQAVLQYISEQTGYTANSERSHVVEPKWSGSNMFYIVVFASEVEADAIRMAHWKKF